jgi:hypothetical protein
MLILFDQGTPLGIRDSLSNHTVKTAHQQGWSMLLNGELLSVAEQAGFDVLLTTDKNLLYQQNLSERKIAIVVLGRGRWSLIRLVLAQVVRAINEISAIISRSKMFRETLINVPARLGWGRARLRSLRTNSDFGWRSASSADNRPRVNKGFKPPKWQIHFRNLFSHAYQGCNGFSLCQAWKLHYR